MNSTERPHAIVATHIVLFRDAQVLLQRRCNTGYEDGNFGLPAGHVEFTEPVGDATTREAEEELGIVLDSAALTLAHVMHRCGAGPVDPPRIDFFMACTSWVGEPRLMEPEKADALEWASVESLPNNTIPYVAAALQAIAAESVYSEHGWRLPVATGK